MIKQLFGVSSKSNVNKEDESQFSSKYKVGDLIEARYRGREKFLPGKIARDCFDGTFDIDYDDGGKEVSVKLEFIKDPRKKFNYKVYSSKTSPSVLDMSNFLLARVMVDFVPTKSFQLTLSKGDIITVIYEGMY